jgi:hypothetical protein
LDVGGSALAPWACPQSRAAHHGYGWCALTRDVMDGCPRVAHAVAWSCSISQYFQFTTFMNAVT